MDQLPGLFGKEVAADRARREQGRRQAAQKEREKQLIANRTAIRLRGLALGKRLTRLWNMAGRDEEEPEFRLSKIAGIPVVPGDENQEQYKIAYRPDERGIGYKSLRLGETRVAVRFVELDSGATSRFHDVASFDMRGWVRYLDPSEMPGVMRPIDAEHPLLATVGQLLGKLEVARFDIKD